MTLKSLLTTAVAVCASASAFAFPTITLNPAPQKYDNADYFTNFTITGSEKITLVSDCPNKPFFENEDTGDMVTCSLFETQDFYGTLMNFLRFDRENFTENGEWTLSFPAGCIQDSEGSTNSIALNYTYYLDDPNLKGGSYPQITLISSDPANGASIPFWGESLGRVSFKTSDDSAVNFIEWFLYDITNGTSEDERQYITQGSENRIDVNRNGTDKDMWTDGIYISVGGADKKLIEGHTYRLTLQFCGIGYDPITNQYPNNIQIAQSLELDTYIDFKGQSKATEYSYWTVESVSPDPNTYDFDNPDMRTFTIKYTGHVKPTMFVYPLGGGAGTASAGTFAPASDPNMDGYAEVWDFTFSQSVLASALGEIQVTIQAKDEDGLFVKGNGDFDVDNFDYNILWKCNIAADRLVSVSPEDGATVDVLSEITVGNEKNKSMNLAYQAESKPMILDMMEAVICELDEPTLNEDGTTFTWKFEEIKKSGTYTIVIPKWYFNCGEDFNGTTNSATRFTYIVKGAEPELEYNLLPASCNIENGQNLTEPLTEIAFHFDTVTFTNFDADWVNLPSGFLYKVNESARSYDTLIEMISPTEEDGNWWEPVGYIYTFTTPISEAGTYKFVVPEGTFFDSDYDQSEHMSGRVNPEYVYNFTYGKQTGVETISAEEGMVTVYDVAGRVVVRNADAAALNGLNKGIYIVNGKKVVVK